MIRSQTLGAKIKYVSLTYENALNKAISAYGITAAQAHILIYLTKNSGKTICQKDIEDAFKLTRSTVNGLLNRLEEKGFVKTCLSSTDRRFKNVEPTEKAGQISSVMKEGFDTVEKLLLTCLSEEEKRALFDILEKIIANIPNDRAPHGCGSGGN